MAVNVPSMRESVVCGACGKSAEAHRHQPHCGSTHCAQRDHHLFGPPVIRRVILTAEQFVEKGEALVREARQRLADERNENALQSLVLRLIHHIERSGGARGW